MINQQINDLSVLADSQDNKKVKTQIYRVIHILQELIHKGLLPEHEKVLIETNNKLFNEIKEGKKVVAVMQKGYQKIASHARKEMHLVTKGYYTGIFLAIGMSIGMALGSALSLALVGRPTYISIGLAMGLAIGVAYGAYKDNKIKEEGRQLEAFEENKKIKMETKIKEV